jgi:ComF family protein
MNWHAIFHQAGQGLLNLVFPPHCIICRSNGAWLCDACLEKFPRLGAEVCRKCGSPLGGTAPFCHSCAQNPLEIEGVRSAVLLEGDARRAVHQLKYAGYSALAAPLARLMAQYWHTAPLPVDVWAAVPLHVARQRERGYNQSYLLGHEFARLVGLPAMSGTLRRVRATRAQVGLNAAERRVNVQGAFAYCPSRDGRGVQGQRVLLIDDVCTTAATLEACAIALKEAGAVGVWGFTLARAAPASDL